MSFEKFAQLHSVRNTGSHAAAAFTATLSNFQPKSLSAVLFIAATDLLINRQINESTHLTMTH